jgi:hypothetical protein
MRNLIIVDLFNKKNLAGVYRLLLGDRVVQAHGSSDQGRARRLLMILKM